MKASHTVYIVLVAFAFFLGIRKFVGSSLGGGHETSRITRQAVETTSIVTEAEADAASTNSMIDADAETLRTVTKTDTTAVVTLTQYWTVDEAVGSGLEFPAPTGADPTNSGDQDESETE